MEAYAAAHAAHLRGEVARLKEDLRVARQTVVAVLGRAEQAEAELARLREQVRWIPVEERLPEPDSSILIHLLPTPENTTFYGKHVGTVHEAYFEGRDDQPKWQDDNGKNIETTHWKVANWMPEPSVPAARAALESTTPQEEK